MKLQTFSFVSLFFLTFATVGIGAENAQQGPAREGAADEPREIVVHQFPVFGPDLPMVDGNLAGAIERFIFDPETRNQLRVNLGARQTDLVFAEGMARIVDTIRNNDNVGIMAINRRNLEALRERPAHDTDGAAEGVDGAPHAGENQAANTTPVAEGDVSLQVRLTYTDNQGDHVVIIDNLDLNFPAELTPELIATLQYKPMRRLFGALNPQPVQGANMLGDVLGGVVNAMAGCAVGPTFSDFRNDVARSAGREIRVDLGEALGQGFGMMFGLLGGIARSANQGNNNQQPECSIQ